MSIQDGYVLNMIQIFISLGKYSSNLIAFRRLQVEKCLGIHMWHNVVSRRQCFFCNVASYFDMCHHNVLNQLFKQIVWTWRYVLVFLHRSEFLGHYFDRGSGAMFQKAKRSLTNSFDQLLKRKNNKDEAAATPAATPAATNSADVVRQPFPDDFTKASYQYVSFRIVLPGEWSYTF